MNIKSNRLILLFAALAMTCAAAASAQQRTTDGGVLYGDPWQATPNTRTVDTQKPEPLALQLDNASDDLAYQGDESQIQDSPDASTEEGSTAEPILWKGFLYGDRHFRSKPRPVGSPLYFEDPFINSDLRPLFIWHKFPSASALKGGQLTVYAMQIHLALTERLQFFATEDGFSHLESPVLDDDTGVNDLAFGLKYALIVDHENDFLLSTGLRWRLSNGHADTLNGNTDELSPFLTMYKGIGKWNLIADVVGRLAMNEDEGNHILSWDVHVDYELMENFFPMLEFHGLHYLHNGDRLPLDVGGLDYANIGSNDVAGTAAFWGGIGFRWKIADHISWGTVYEFPLQDPQNNDIFDQRVTSNLVITF